MATPRVDQILEVWRELERDHEGATDTDLKDAIEARIYQLRRQYHEATGTPPEEPEVREQLKLPLVVPDGRNR